MASLATFREKLVMSVEGEVRFDRGTIAIYSHDASNYRQVPIGVVMPRHEEDVIATIALARENSIPILARGGGTALGGQATSAALVLDFSKYMNRVMAVDPDKKSATVQPGVIQSALNAELAPHGSVLRARSFNQGSMHHRRDDRQQLMRRAFRGLRQDRRQPRIDGGAALRRHAY